MSGSGEMIAWVHAALRRHVEEKGQALDVCEPVPFAAQGAEFINPIFTVQVRGSSGIYSYVVKVTPPEDQRNYLSIWQLFDNESLFYGEFQRFVVDAAAGGFDGAALFPKVFCEHVDGKQCLLALEDLRPLGFKLAPKILDLAHMKLALRELGRFHALSYVAKKKDPHKFFGLMKRFNAWDEDRCRMFFPTMRGLLQYAVELFLAEFPEEGAKHADRLDKLDAVVEKFCRLLEPEEPLAVLCHGDYNRNNIMFAYDSSGRPSLLKIYDFQMATYSSPSIDLSLLLFLSTTPEVRDAHWDELFDVYHASLLDTMASSLGCTRAALEHEHSKELLMKDFGKFCMHGFVITAFFLPETMMNAEDTQKMLSECPSGTCPERVAAQKRFYSDEVKHRLAVLVKVMIDRNYL